MLSKFGSISSGTTTGIDKLCSMSRHKSTSLASPCGTSGKWQLVRPQAEFVTSPTQPSPTYRRQSKSGGSQVTSKAKSTRHGTSPERKEATTCENQLATNGRPLSSSKAGEESNVLDTAGGEDPGHCFT